MMWTEAHQGRRQEDRQRTRRRPRPQCQTGHVTDHCRPRTGLGGLPDSLRNKAIPRSRSVGDQRICALAVITLLMMAAPSCFEGFEKLAHKFLHRDVRRRGPPRRATERLPTPDRPAYEADTYKIKASVLPSLAEIIVITLGTADAPFTTTTVLVGIAILITIGVQPRGRRYRVLDDLGLHLNGAAAIPVCLFQRKIGCGISSLAGNGAS